VDQAKFRIDNWRQRGDQAKVQADREAGIQRQEKEQEKVEQRKKRGPFQVFLQILVGLAALAAFIFLLIRMPRKSSPYAVMCLYKNMLEMIQEALNEGE
jgi:hypothetical protein